jgi:hypothetical protein
MVLSTGGGYYPFYLFGCLSVLVGMKIAFANASERWLQLRRAAAIALLSAGLLAVMILPIADGFRYTRREAPPDQEQKGSQTIPYALMNYAISQPEWFNTTILGNSGGWNWFYIGALPLAALALLPLALRERTQRAAVLAVAVLLLFLLAWHANKYTPFQYLYQWFPWLYILRFPGRLLIVATSPLLVLAGLGLQHLYQAARDWIRSFYVTIAKHGEVSVAPSISLLWVADGILIAVLFLSLRDVYTVNKSFAFAPRPIDPKSFEALSWLKSYDRELYYTNIGGGSIIWGWTPAAYSLEMPLINVDYNRRLLTYDQQHQPEAPFFAKPKYMLAAPDQPRPPEATLVRDFDGIELWYLPDALPFAFNVPSALLQSGAAITPKDVSPLNVQFDGPNRIVVSGTSEQESELVVLASDYPGWRLFVDGQPAPIISANAYLGAHMQLGQHTYTFSFLPTKYYIGLAISILTLLSMLIMLLADVPLRSLRYRLVPVARQGLQPGTSNAQELIGHNTSGADQQ